MSNVHRRYRLLLLLLLIMFSMVSVTLLYARAQPLSPHLEMFHLPNCTLPCWNGIVPGKTTIAEALTLLRTQYPPPTYFVSPQYVVIKGLRWYIVSRKDDRAYLSVAFNTREDSTTQTEATVITQITILPNPNAKLTLADWHRLLGQPQEMAIAHINDCGWSGIYYPSLLYLGKGTRLSLFNEADPYAVQSVLLPVIRLDIFSAIETVYPSAARVEWHGISKANKYKLLPLLRAA